jgi:hypothetical protein
MIRSFVLMDGSLVGGTVGGRYKGPGDGWLDAITTVLYLGGLIIAAIRFRRFALWWCLFVIPLCFTQLLSTGAPDGARGLQAVVPMYIFVGATLDLLLAWRGWAAFSRAHWLVAAGVLAVCVYNVVSYVQYVDSPYAQSARQPAVSVANFYIWRDYQLSRLRQNIGTIPAGTYDTLPPSVVAGQIFSSQNAP